jgi:hypothetical protein
MESTKAKIGVLGTGVVGQTLGAGFAGLGHDVMMGSREPGSDKVKGWVEKTGPRASAGTFAETAVFGDILVLATLGSGTEAALGLAGHENLAGKIVIDTTNPLVFEPNALPALGVGHSDSGGEQVQRWIPKSRVVKAFNTVGAPHMVNPSFPGGPPDMFICGDDEGAKRAVTEICSAFGWSTIDVGGIEGSRLLEPMCVLWVVHGIRSGTWNHAFKLLKK